MIRSFLFASGFVANSRTRDHAIKHAHGLLEHEIAVLDEVVRALLARTDPAAQELRAVLVQRGGVVLSLRGRRGRDHEGRASWVVFGRLEGDLEPRAPWSARTVVEDASSEALPVPPPPDERDAEYATFFATAREEGRAWRFDERAPHEAQRKAPWLAGLIALGLVLAMVSPWPAPAPTSLPDAEARAGSRPGLQERLAQRVRAERGALREELRFLDEHGIWRFGRAGEAEVADPDAAELQRALRSLRAAVEGEGELAPIAWSPRAWPRDGQGRCIEGTLVLLGSRTLSGEELRAVSGWLALLQEFYLRAEESR